MVTNKRLYSVYVALLAFVSCGKTAVNSTPGTAPWPSGAEHGRAAATSGAPLSSPDAIAIAAAYDSFAAKFPDASYATLVTQLSIKPAADRALSFDPTAVPYFDRIARELQLTAEERKLYQKSGLVSVDHQQRHSMGSAYFAIYARELPVLITSDSILHALHRSYDDMLKALELAFFMPVLDETLSRAHETLSKRQSELGQRPLASSASDVDVYLTVARNLLHGGGAASVVEPGFGAPPAFWVGSRLGNDAPVKALLSGISSLKLQPPHLPSELYGGRRAIDYSQFRPRGHYTESEQLKRYFRTMMWLGRADTAFILAPPDPQSALEVDAPREARSAALLTRVLAESGGVQALARLSAIIDFMVGRADNATLENMQTALERHGVKANRDLADDALMEKVRRELSTLAAQRIRSQVLLSSKDNPHPVTTPQAFQVFGQRFVLDSFVLSKVVFDSIVFEGHKQERMMPSGLDVMAALGNDEAVRLLQPEIEKHRYATNLLAARKAIDARKASSWSSDLYSIWLDALRELDDPQPGSFPEAMQRRPWRRKQLQTELASWAELRHDTILYAKQSYTAYPECGYPAGFVEPYPEFYEKLEGFALRGASLLKAAAIKLTDPALEAEAQRTRDAEVVFLQSFAKGMAFLRVLAEKELAGKPFSSDEEAFLRKTIDMSGGGSGPPRYDGWYPQLFFGREPRKWKPSVADVHTNPVGDEVLEVGVGDVNFLVVAVDNQGDRAAYVGPVYTYYEFTKPASARMTDEEWERDIESGKLPPRPAFTAPFVAKAALRSLGLRTEQGDERLRKRIQVLVAEFGSADPQRQDELYEEVQRLRRELARNAP